MLLEARAERRAPLSHFWIDRVRFLDNGGVKSGFGIFGHGFAQVKFLGFVTPSDQNPPQLDKWMKTNDPAAKQAALDGAEDTRFARADRDRSRAG
jgi:hypothetical protein